MKVDSYFPAKNLVLLEAIKTGKSTSGNIILAEEKFVGYYKVKSCGKLCEMTKAGDYVVSTLQMGVEITFEEGIFTQLPEQGIDGYYSPTPEELKKPVPIMKDMDKPEEEELNIIDSNSDGGNNDLGTQFAEH